MRVLSSGLMMGAAASLAMVSSAGAADLPMKAKAPAVEYVKVCSLYGAGFYYIPGTDTCLKVGGHLRADFHGGPSGAPTESVNFNANYDVASQRYFYTRARAYATFDARAQTEYGTLRSYFLIGFTYDGSSNGNAGSIRNLSEYMTRAFIQLAGFTWGLSTSIFDAYSATPFHLNAVVATNGSIGAVGIWQWRYTAQFGNGFSASIAVEEPRMRVRPFFGCPLVGPVAAGCHVGAQWPDVLGRLQASGSWGRAQIGFAVKDASATALVGVGNSEINKIGWAAMIGGFLRVPGLPGDNFGFQFTYAEGATDYVTANYNTAATGIGTIIKGGNATIGIITDGVYTSPTTIELTKAWGFEVGYQHAWTPTLNTSLAGGYVNVENPGVAICGTNGCADTKFWNIGSRTQWSPVPNLRLSLDVLYTHVDQLPFFAGVAGGDDADIWRYLVRVRRDYWP